MGVREEGALAAGRGCGLATGDWRRLCRLSSLALVLCATAAAGSPEVRRVSIASSAGPDSTYSVGDRISVTVQFDAGVEVTGVPALLIDVGGTLRRAVMWMHAGSRVHFGYTVRRPDEDRDGISIGARSIRLRGGRIDGQGGEAADLSFGGHAIANAAGHKVDGAGAWPPSIVDVSVSSNPGVDGAYNIGDHIELTVEYDEPVFVEGLPTLAVRIGDDAREAPYRDGSGSHRLSFTTRVWDGNLADGGIEIPDSGLAGAAGITDADGNVAPTDFAGQGRWPGHRVDTVEPRVVGLEVLSTPPSGGAYVEGDAIEMAVTFDEDVYLVGPERIPVWPESPVEPRYATAVESSGRSVVFRHFVLPGDVSARLQIGRGQLSGTPALERVWQSIRDRAGNVANPVYSGSGQFHNAPLDGSRPDTRPPAVDRVAFVSEPRDGLAYGRGEVIAVRVVFTEPLQMARPAADVPAPARRLAELDLDLGGNVRTLRTWVSNGDFFATFTHDVTESDVDADGISLVGSVRVGPVQDAAGNRSDGVSLEFDPFTDARHTVNGERGDRARPRLIRSRPGWLTFDGMVEPRGAPEFHVAGARRSTGFRRPWSSFLDRDLSLWHLNYNFPAIAEDDFDRDGVSIPPEGWADVTFHDARGRPVDVDPDDIALPDSGDPVIGSAFAGVLLNPPPHGGSRYGTGDTLSFDVVLDQWLNVTGAARLKVGVRELPCSPRNGRIRHLVCSRVIAAGENVARLELARGAFRLIAGSITDDAGNPIDGDLSAFAHMVEPFAIDTRPARVERLVITSRPAANGAYGARAALTVVVRFSEPVSAAGVEQLALVIGSQTRLASLEGSAGADGLQFRYVLAASDADADGLAIPADAVRLNGGAITDRAGNPAELAHDAVSDRAAHRVNGSVVDVSTTPIRVQVGAAPAPALGSPTSAAKSSMTWEAVSAWSGQPAVAYRVQASHPDVLVGRASGRIRPGQSVTNNLRMRCVTGGTANIPVTISVQGTVAPVGWDVLCRDGLIRVREAEVFQGPLAGRFRPRGGPGRVAAIEGRQSLLRVNVEHEGAAVPQIAVGASGPGGVEPLEVEHAGSQRSGRKHLSRYIVPLAAAQVAQGQGLDVVANPDAYLDADVTTLPHLDFGALAPKTLPAFKPVFVPVQILSAAPSVDADALLTQARSLLPIARVTARVREPFVYEPSEAERSERQVQPRRLFNTLVALANAEGAADEFHIGVGATPAGWGAESTHLVGAKVQLLLGDSIATESVAFGVGWGFGLRDVPCRTLGDPGFPYAGIAVEGSWSFHEQRFVTVGDGYYDLMSGCSPQHISNYSYRRAMAWGDRVREALRRNGGEELTATSAAASAGAPAGFQQLGGQAGDASRSDKAPATASSLTLSGSVDEDGHWSLFASATSSSPPRLDAPGDFVLTLHDDSGVEMYRQGLAAAAVGDSSGRPAGMWAVRVPLQEREIRAARIRDAAGEVLLDADVHLPARPPAQLR